MQLTINKQVYDIYFGIDALDYLNTKYEMTDPASGNMNLNPIVGEGLRFLVSSLSAGNPVGVANFIKAGTNTLRAKPSNRDIDTYIGELIENDKLGELCIEMLDFLKSQPLTRKLTVAITEATEQTKEQAKPKTTTKAKA